MNANCTVCLECLKYPIGRPDSCEHKFCFECISNWLKRRSQCPLCGRVPKYLIKIDESKRETKVAVKKRTAKQFENELIVRDQLEEGDSDPLADDITVTYASCRVCKRSDNEHLLLLCDGNVGRNSDGSMIRCNVAYHSYCLPEKLYYIPKDDWFCPFCINKPENFINSSSKVGTSNFTRSKKNQIEDTYQNLETHLNENSKQSSGTKMKCSSTANSGSAIADHHTASGDSDAEPESNKSDESSEIYSVADESSDNYDDEYEGDDTEMIMESSSELSVDGSETEDTNGKFHLPEKIQTS
uniref:RING-type domain-containing protein n=1 Tax=Setaria digitata TaxID=48799 RepID=A0A915PM92_9BILA